MRTRFFYRMPCTIGVILALAACHFHAVPVHADSNGESGDTGIAEISMAVNDFAWNVYRQIIREETNVFIAPYSVSSALAMTLAGARNQTAAEMAAALQFIDPAADYHDGFFRMNRSLMDIPDITMNVANALFPAESFIVNPDFLHIMQAKYGSDVTPLDYAGAVESSRAHINDWVERQTHHKIVNLISPGAIDPATVLVLVNAIYFKGEWHSKFDPANTRKQPFHNASGRIADIWMMHRKGMYSYAETPEYVILEMPFTSGRLAMTFILPNPGIPLEAVETGLNHASLSKVLNTMTPVSVSVAIPRFKMEWGAADIGLSLQNLGMKKAFSPDADFGGISNMSGIYISRVLHKACVEVNEEGSEAAGATAVLMRKTAAPKHIEFTADRPFVFFIRDTLSQVILFTGRMIESS